MYYIIVSMDGNCWREDKKADAESFAKDGYYVVIAVGEPLLNSAKVVNEDGSLSTINTRASMTSDIMEVDADDTRSNS